MRTWWLFSLLFALFLTGCAKDQEIVSHLSEQEANEILVLLDDQGIEAKRQERPGRQIQFAVMVPGKRASDARRLLLDHRLPREKSTGFGEVYPVGGAGLLPSRTEERAKYVMALQGEVENMVKVLPGVLRAKATIVLPDPELVRDHRAAAPRATASVAIVYRPLSTSDAAAFSPEDIRVLVASAVEDLSPAAVSVLLSKGSASEVKKAVQNEVAPPAPKPEVAQASYSSSAGFIGPRQEAALAPESGRGILLLFSSISVLGIGVGLVSVIRLRAFKKKMAVAA